MSYFTKIIYVAAGATIMGSTVFAQDSQDNYVEIDPAPSGVELHVNENGAMGLPGADSGGVYHGGFDYSGKRISTFHFSNGGGAFNMDDTTIFLRNAVS